MDHVDKFLGAPTLGYNLSEAISVDSVESLSEIYECDVETSILLMTLLLELPHDEYHVYCAPVLSEATLSFREEVWLFFWGRSMGALPR